MSDQASKFHQLIEWAEENDAPEHLLDLKEFGRFHKPVCVKCQIGMKVDENGVYVIDTFLDPPQPYQLWSADQWVCPICGHKVINGFSNSALQHHRPDFEDRLERAKKQLHVYSFEKIRHAKEMIEVNSTDLIPGKWVDIYQKPLTGEDFEGRARLIAECEGYWDDDPSIQRWKVRFENDDDASDTYERTIMAQFANAGSE